MTRNADTQEYLKAAALQSVAELRAEATKLRPFILAMGGVAQQALVLHAMLAVAETTETDAGLREKLDQCGQRLRAIAHAQSEVERHCRTLVAAINKWHELDEELRNLAKERGYSA